MSLSYIFLVDHQLIISWSTVDHVSIILVYLTERKKKRGEKNKNKQFWQHLTIFTTFDNLNFFTTLDNFLTIFTIWTIFGHFFDNFDKFLQFWQFLTIFTSFDSFYNFCNFWQFLHLLTVLTILNFFLQFWTILGQFLRVFENFYNWDYWDKFW